MPPYRWLEETRSEKGTETDENEPRRRRESQSSVDEPSQSIHFSRRFDFLFESKLTLLHPKTRSGREKREFKLRTALAFHSPKTRRARPPFPSPLSLEFLPSSSSKASSITLSLSPRVLVQKFFPSPFP